MKVLAVDVGGTHVKILATGQTEKHGFAFDPRLGADEMVEQVKALAEGWACDRVTVGYPGPVVHDRPAAEPHNLGTGWLGFDFAKAFGMPTRVSRRGLKRRGKKKWRQHVADVIRRLTAAMEPDEIVLGGGNAALIKKLPPLCRMGDNANAFEGGYRAWEEPAAPHPTAMAKKAAATGRRVAPSAMAARRKTKEG